MAGQANPEIQVAVGGRTLAVDKRAVGEAAAKVGLYVLGGVGAGALVTMAATYGVGVVVWGAAHGVASWVTAHLAPEVYKPAIDHCTRPRFEELQRRVEALEQRLGR